MIINIHDFQLKIIHVCRKAFIVTPAFFICLSVQAGIETDRIQGLINEGKLRQALTLTDRQLQENEASVTFRFLKGLILTRLDELDKARDLFVELTREHPELPEPYNNLAVIYASQGDFEKARDALQQAINTHPSYATAHENMGDIYAKMASKAYNQALQLDADNTSAKAKLSLVNDLFFVPKPEPAVEETVAAMQSQPQAASKPEAMEKPEPVIAEQVSASAPAPEPAKVEERDIDAERRQAAEAKKQEQEITRAEVAAVIDAWATAWSGQDSAKYVSFYGKDFTPPKKLSRAAWETQRKVRLAKPKFIKITIAKLEISQLGDNHARASFRQSYQSDTYQDEVSKSLILKKIGEKWLITQEQSN